MKTNFKIRVPSCKIGFNWTGSILTRLYTYIISDGLFHFLRKLVLGIEYLRVGDHTNVVFAKFKRESQLIFLYDIPLSGLLQDPAEHLEMHLDAIWQQGDNRRPTETHPARQRRL
jgi:hypothetical protein